MSDGLTLTLSTFFDVLGKIHFVPSENTLLKDAIFVNHAKRLPVKAIYDPTSVGV